MYINIKPTTIPSVSFMNFIRMTRYYVTGVTPNSVSVQVSIDKSAQTKVMSGCLRYRPIEVLCASLGNTHDVYRVVTCHRQYL